MIILVFFGTHWVLALFSQTFFVHRYASHRMFSMSRRWERFFALVAYVSHGFSYLNPRAHAILHRMIPLAPDRTTVICDWLFAPDVVAAGADVSKSVELFDRVNRQDFEACARTQPSMSSRAYREGGVLVPSEHHISEFHSWLRVRLE